MALREGKILATITAPQVDKIFGLKAVGLCREGLNADAVMIILDAHTAKYQSSPGLSMEQAEEEYHKKFPKRMQDMCDDDGACATGLISDCLICQYWSNTEHWLQTLMYDYKNKEKTSLTWTETKDNAEYQIGGFVYENVKRLMTMPKGIDLPGVQSMRTALKLTQEDTYFRMGRAAVQVLMDLGYIVFVAKDFTDLIPEDCAKQEFGMPQFCNS